MDDPFDQNNSGMPDVQLIDDDEDGPDNRPSGESPWTDSATTDESGEAYVTFEVSMQPGNKYRAGASCLQDALDQADQADADALNEFPHGPNWSGYQVPVVWSKMLTVWRKLHVETDSMVRPVFPQNTWTMDWDEARQGGVATQILFEVDDPPPDGADTESQQFTDGYVDLRTAGGDTIVIARVVDYTTDEGIIGDLDFKDEVTINVPDCGGGQSGLACLQGITSGTAVFSDDDLSEEATFAAKVWGCDNVYAGGGTALAPPDLSAMQLRYHPAYVEPVHEIQVSATGGITTFLRNQGFGALANYGKALWDQVLPIRALPVSTVNYWTVMVVSAWQAEEGKDADPDSETQSPGTVLGANTHDEGETTAIWWLGSYYTGICAVFKALSTGPAETERAESFTVAPEVGHTFGLPHNDVGDEDPPMGLMDPKGPGQDLRFIAVNLKRLREYGGP